MVEAGGVVGVTIPNQLHDCHAEEIFGYRRGPTFAPVPDTVFVNSSTSSTNPGSGRSSAGALVLSGCRQTVCLGSPGTSQSSPSRKGIFLGQQVRGAKVADPGAFPEGESQGFLGQ